jgi:hypothetical protein
MYSIHSAIPFTHFRVAKLTHAIQLEVYGANTHTRLTWVSRASFQGVIMSQVGSTPSWVTELLHSCVWRIMPARSSTMHMNSTGIEYKMFLISVLDQQKRAHGTNTALATSYSSMSPTFHVQRDKSRRRCQCTLGRRKPAERDTEGCDESMFDVQAMYVLWNQQSRHHVCQERRQLG